MSVAKRKWTTPSGEVKEKWVVRYTDASGKRRLKTFKTKKQADEFEARTFIGVKEGTHVPDSASATVTEAGKLWLASSDAAGLERGTVDGYRQHLELHISPFIGARRLSQLTIPGVREFEDELRAAGRSSVMVRKVLTSLGSLLADAQERGLVGHNVVRDARGRRKRGKERQHEARHRGKLKVGVDIPSPAEVKALIAAVDGRWRPLILTAIFTGLRASELRGLRWEDVDLTKSEVHVHQRADIYNAIGAPKSISGERTVPMPPHLTNALREWRLACPRRATGEKDSNGDPVKVLDLVFPNGNGRVENRANMVNRGLHPAWVAAGVTVDTGKRDKDGRPILAAKYQGLHCLRHFFASWCLNRKVDGGLELPLKVAQERLGHSSIQMTADTYGHLFARGDDHRELAEAAGALFGA